MSEYRSVEGEVGAVNVLTGLTTFGGETGVGPIKVPAASSRLVEIWVGNSVGPDTAGENGATLLRLSGKGMAQGDQDFVIGGSSTGVTATGSQTTPAAIMAVDIAVTPNENITVQVMVVNSAVLVGNVGITLVFA